METTGKHVFSCMLASLTILGVTVVFVLVTQGGQAEQGGWGREEDRQSWHVYGNLPINETYRVQLNEGSHSKETYKVQLSVNPTTKKTYKVKLKKLPENNIQRDVSPRFKHKKMEKKPELFTAVSKI